jgi:hypothetical protein
MKTLLYVALLGLALSCTKTESDIVAPKNDSVQDDYADWYTVKAPIDDRIEGVWGSYEKTLLISMMNRVFRSTDKGKNWELVHKQSIGIFGFVQNQDTLFTMNGLVSQTFKDAYQQVLIHADNYSLDDGKTWQRYSGRNAVLSDIPKFDSVDKRLRINPVIASNGTSYRINRVFLDGPTATVGIFETPGVVTPTGRRLDLPQLHQLQSLHLDEQQRLYLVGSDAVCGRGHSGEAFKFCNSKGGRGVVYISKKPLP